MFTKDFRWRGILRLGTRSLTVLGLLFLVVTLTPIDRWWAEKLAGEQYCSAGDVLVVLGGAAFEDGEMEWNSYLRCRYAGRSYRTGGFNQIMVSGGPSPRSKVAVAIAMGESLECLGVPARAIRLETVSRSTRENALYSAPTLNALKGRKVLLTSDYHIFRARRAFAKVGVEVLPQPIPDVQKRGGNWLARWPAFVDLVVESGKIGYYWLQGWI